jgi:uncharacterized SAM-dependent methyltransferase
MSSCTRVVIHSSQFPEAVGRDLVESLRSRRVNHKFLYDSIKQTRKWLALHQAFSPSRTDADCAATYDRSFASAAARISADSVHLIGLGCGGGQKDTRLLGLLKRAGANVYYTPCDVSTAMVLVARQAALSVIPEAHCFPFVCDLAATQDFAEIANEGIRLTAGSTRVVTFFGMMPNFEPEQILSRLTTLLRPGDFLLLSANLAPGADYDAGVKKILPLYDNHLTRDWLMTFLLDLGVETADGELRFQIEADPAGGKLKRVAAHFYFVRSREVWVNEERFEFQKGDAIRLFFSYRHTPAWLREALRRYGLNVLEDWITQSTEEGVFLATRSG